MKPGVMRSGAGFREHRRAARAQRTPPARRSTSRLVPVPSSFPLCCWEWSSNPALRQPPTHAGRCPARASPHPSNRPEKHRPPFPEGDPRVLISDLWGRGRGPAWSRAAALSSSRRDRALTAGHGCKMDSRRQPCPAPAPSSPGTSTRLLGRASPLFRLPSLSFPRGGGGEGQWVR